MTLCAIISISCKPSGNKFAGQWQPLTYGMFPKRAVITIEKQGSQWIITNSLSPGQPILLSYIEKYDMLSGMFGPLQANITYNPKTDHLVFKPITSAGSTEFKRVTK